MHRLTNLNTLNNPNTLNNLTNLTNRVLSHGSSKIYYDLSIGNDGTEYILKCVPKYTPARNKSVLEIEDKIKKRAYQLFIYLF